MKKISLLLLAILISSCTGILFAQQIFREGYVVKNSGESLTGLIEYSDKQDIPPVCTFKRFDIARSVVYYPEDIQAFGYRNGNRFESREVNGRKSFLEVIVTGKIILYQKGSKYFIDKDHTGLTELKKGPFTYNWGEANRGFRSLSEFLNFITEGKAGPVPEKFNTKNEIVPLITSYNRASGGGYSVFNRTITEKQLTQQAWRSGANKNRIGLLTGANLYMLNLKFNPDVFGNSVNSYVPDPEKEIGLVAGLTYERLLFRRTDRFSARIDILYGSQNFYCYGERGNHVGGITRDDAYFSFSGIKIPVMLQYSFTGGRIVPYVNAGAAYRYFIRTSYRHVYEVENIMHEITTFEDNNMLFRKGEITEVAGLGLRARLTGNRYLHLMLEMEFGKGVFLNADPSDINNRANKPYVENSLQSTLLIGITF